MEKPKDMDDMTFNYDLYLAYLQSNEWFKKKKERLLIDDYACAICGNRGNQLDVHHVLYPHRLGTEEMSDLLTVCRDCHKLLDDLRKGQCVKPKQIFYSHYICEISVNELKDFYDAEKDLLKKYHRCKWENRFNLVLKCSNDEDIRYFSGFSLKDIKYLKEKYGESDENKKSSFKVFFDKYY